MEEKSYSIGKFARLSGVPIRTLHYYDEAGLLHPRRQPSGHRVYDMNDLIILQKIISLKSLGFSLERIRTFIHEPQMNMSLAETLRMQQQAMESARDELDKSLDILKRLQVILEREGKLEHEMLFMMIRNMNREDKQRQWVSEHLSPQTASALFERSPEAEAELDQEMLTFAQAVKQLSQGRPDTVEAEEMLAHYIERVLSFLDEEAIASISSISEEEHDQLNQLVDMPLDQRETEWLDEALLHYANKHGLHGLQ